jgi:hypothetical protein
MSRLLSQAFWTDSSQSKKIVERERPKLGLFGQLCCLFGDQKAKRILDLGEASIGREFEVVKFIKLQKRLRTMLDIIFSPKEKAILK